jgi:hypothetical protein
MSKYFLQEGAEVQLRWQKKVSDDLREQLRLFKRDREERYVKQDKENRQLKTKVDELERDLSKAVDMLSIYRDGTKPSLATRLCALFKRPPHA